MKKLFSLLLIISLAQVSKGQELKQAISFNIIDAQYKADNSTLTFDLSVKNNTDSVVYILNPKPKFFNINYSEFDVLGKYGLYQFPYQLVISSNKKCEFNEEERIVATENGSQINLLPFMIKILPNSTELFKSIQIKRNDGLFCKKQIVTLQLKYIPEIKFFERYSPEALMTQYQLVMKETATLNNMLSNDAKEFQSIEPDNFKKLNEFLTLTLPTIRKLNGVTFVSTSAIAAESK